MVPKGFDRMHAEGTQERTAPPFRVFISSPGGLDEERSIVVDELSRLSADAKERGEPGILPIRWPQEIGSGIGYYGQQVINRQADGYDILLCIVSTRLGTPTPRANSGTEEELDIAIETILRGKPIQVLVFFSDIPVRPSVIDPYQLMLVRVFQAKVSRLGILYQTYHTLEELRERVGTSLREAHKRLALDEPLTFKPRSPKRRPTEENIRLENKEFVPQITSPQWADSLPIPMSGYRGRTMRIEGKFRSTSPYFRFGFKYGDVREPLFSSGSIQTPGQNIVVHIGRNATGKQLFLTTYRGGLRLEEDQSMSGTEKVNEAVFRIGLDRSGEVIWEFGALPVYRMHFPIDGHQQLWLMAWGDEHNYRCDVANLCLRVLAN